MAKSKSTKSKRQAKEVMGRLKRLHRGLEIHHIFNRRYPRLTACSRFCTPIIRPDGGFNHHDNELVKENKLRSRHWQAFVDFEDANYQNRDQTTCWWKKCGERALCPLAEENEVYRDGRRKGI